MKTSELGVTGFCEGNPPVTDEIPSPMASNAESASIDNVIMEHYFLVRNHNCKHDIRLYSIVS